MAFDPGEPRDEKGKWTASSYGPSIAVHDPANAVKANDIAHIAAGVSKNLGFDPKLISVSDESKTFELNGKTLFYAGVAHLPGPKGDGTVEVKGTVTLYTPHTTAESAPGLTAHEIEHQKYQAFVNDYKDEYARMLKDPAYLSSIPKWEGDKRVAEGSDTFMKPDGTLHDPHAANYPVYSAWQEAMKPSSQDFAKSDGVSGYSRDWWDAYHKNTARLDQAMNETLAEIARLRYESGMRQTEHENNVAQIKANGGSWSKQDEQEWKSNSPRNQITHIVRKANGFLTLRKGIDPIWNKLYQAAEANWKRRNK